jgi:LysR family transcriptional activator of nhaA
VRERYYVISAERRLRHPGVLAMTSAARDELFT